MSPSTDEQESLLIRLSKVATVAGFQCSQIEQLNGGSVNFVFRGVLSTPILDASGKPSVETVLIKHSASFLSCNKDFALDVSRWSYEVHMLQALEKFQASEKVKGFAIRTPKLLHADHGACTQIIEFIPESVDLKQILVSPLWTNFSSAQACSSGGALGRWLRDFYDWTSHPDQAPLHQHVRRNNAMSELKYRVEYGIIFTVLEKFPDILGSHREVLEEVVTSMNEESRSNHVSTDGWSIIHGDFWAGNVLVSMSSHEVRKPAEIYIIDWEYAQHGHHAFDLGQMIADLLERHHFAHSMLALETMQGFVKGYGEISEDLALRTAIHTGAHMIGWYTRRNPNSPLPAPLDVATEFMQMAALFIVKAWEKDTDWFLESPLKCLFEMIPSKCSG